MSTFTVQFITQDGSFIEIADATVAVPVEFPSKVLSDIATDMLTTIENYSSLLISVTDPLLKGITHAMLVETLGELRKDLNNLSKIVAVCYLLRTLEDDEPLCSIKLSIDEHEYVHDFVHNTLPSNVYVASTLRS